MSKKNALIAVAIENGVLTFTVGTAGTVEVAVDSLPDDIKDRAMLHGLTQKVSDAAAMPKADLTGDPVKDAETKLAAMRAVAERIASGEWSKRSGDGSGPVQGVIYRAFAEFVGNRAKKAKKDVPTEEAIRAVYDAKSRSDQLALRNVPEIAAIIERMKSERGTTGAEVDTTALLGELGL